MTPAAKRLSRLSREARKIVDSFEKDVLLINRGHFSADVEGFLSAAEVIEDGLKWKKVRTYLDDPLRSDAEIVKFLRSME